MNLTERLDQHLKSIKEVSELNAQDIAKVKSLIDGNDYDAKLQKALLDCCKSGNFRPSAALDKALEDVVIDYAHNDDDYEYIKDSIKHLLNTRDWEGSLLISIIGDDFMFGFNKLGVSNDFKNIWNEGVKYCQSQKRKLYNRIINKEV